MAETRSEELKDTNYEIFIIILSLLSVLNWILYFVLDDPATRDVVLFMDIVLSLIFMADFAYRLFTAGSKRVYFLRQFGWLDLISSLPFPQAKIARLGRVVRAYILLRQMGVRRVVRELLLDRAEAAVYIVTILILLVLEFGSVGILAAEQNAPGASIVTAIDAVWWSIVTIATVGYGDYTPVTAPGRVIGVLVIIVGVALFGVVTGFLANRFVGGLKDQGSDSAQAEMNVILEELKLLRNEQNQSRAELERRIEQIDQLLRQSRESA